MDLLDTLEWKPWPKTPEWSYADIPDVARIATKAGSNTYSLRRLEDDGRLGNDFSYRGLEREKVLSILDEIKP